MKEKDSVWYECDVADVLARHKSTEKLGLTNNEVIERQKKHGKNVFTQGKSISILERTLAQLKNPLAYILLFATLATAFLREYVDAGIIASALLVNVLIGLYQEGRAGKSFEKLRASQEEHAVVIRDGEKKQVDGPELVPGDIVVIETGMKMVADIRVIRANTMSVNESQLTGEWIDVDKMSDPVAGPLPPSQQKNMLFAGSLVTEGNGLGIVVATGDATQLGLIARELRDTKEEKTPLQKEIAKVARLMAWVVLFSLVGIFFLGIYRGEELSELFLIAVAIAVSAIPEGLPTAVTVVLAIGMEAILARGGLVRNLLSAETLGSTTVILTDKTGTLTKAQMEVTKIITLGTILSRERHTKIDGKLLHEAHGDERDVLLFATFGSDAFIDRNGGEEVVRGRPVERAVVSAALASGMNQTQLLHNYPRLDFLSFTSAQRFAAAINDIRGIKPNRYYFTGAPEYMLERAKDVYLEGKTRPKTKAISEKFEHELRAHTEKGMRLIGIAMKDTDSVRFTEDEKFARSLLLEGSTFCGFIALSDPLREDVASSIRIAQDAGARVIMATGDNRHTAVAIASECGIYKEGDTVLTGDEIAKLSESELWDALRHASVLARMLPESKLRVATLLEAHHEVVAMTGDGVNDAPALRAANIGVALGSGTEVAKEASDLVLLSNSFSVIVSAIEEGRRIVDNIKKIIAYLLSTSFGELLLVAGAMFAVLPIPLLPAQILWINMLTEGLLNFAYAFEPKEEDAMRRHPKRDREHGIMTNQMLGFIAIVSIFLGIILFAMYVLFQNIFMFSLGESRGLLFIALFMSAIASALTIKDLRTPIWKIHLGSNRYLLGSLAVSFLGLFIGIVFPPLSRILSLDVLPIFPAFSVAALMFLLMVIVLESGKYFMFERRNSA